MAAASPGADVGVRAAAGRRVHRGVEADSEPLGGRARERHVRGPAVGEDGEPDTAVGGRAGKGGFSSVELPRDNHGAGKDLLQYAALSGSLKRSY